jgi:hypothetical protein
MEKYRDEQGQWWIKFPTTTRRRAEERTCDGCGSAYVALKTSKGRFCGQSCGGKFAAAQRTAIPRGPDSQHWKGGRHIRKRDGYVTVNVGGKQVLEHRVVMERHLGRQLRADETVHHLNGDKADNRIENLELWTGRHGKGVRHDEAEAHCSTWTCFEHR